MIAAVAKGGERDGQQLRFAFFFLFGSLRFWIRLLPQEHRANAACCEPGGARRDQNNLGRAGTDPNSNATEDAGTAGRHDRSAVAVRVARRMGRAAHAPTPTSPAGPPPGAGAPRRRRRCGGAAAAARDRRALAPAPPQVFAHGLLPAGPTRIRLREQAAD